MFEKFGGLIDRAGAHGLAVVGTVGLALVSAFGSKLGVVLTIWLAILCGLLSVAGTVVGVVRYEKRRRHTRVQLLTGLRGTLIPTTELFIKVAPTVDDQSFADALTDLTARCAQFVKSADSDAPDANVYLLEKETALVRVNRSGGTARERFDKTRRQDARAKEETAVVDRVLASQVTICDDTQSQATQVELCLEAKPRKYRAFISVPIVLDNKPVGMISVNSARKDHLTDVHLAFLENTAVLVSALLAVKVDRNVALLGQERA